MGILYSAFEIALFALVTVVAVTAGALAVFTGLTGHALAAQVSGLAFLLDLYAGALILT